MTRKTVNKTAATIAAVKAHKSTPAKASRAKAKTVKRPVKQDIITNVQNTADGNAVYVGNSTNAEMFTRSVRGDSKEFRALAKVGLSFDDCQAWHEANPVPAKAKAKLARGVEPRKAPHSAKAVADQTPAATGKGKARAAKADKAKQPSRGTDRAYSNGKREDTSKPDTFRRYMLSTIMGHKSTADAKAAHAKSGKFPTHKLDFNWSAQQGYIVFAK